MFECLERGSRKNILSPLLRIHQKLRSYLVWWVENLGWRAAVKHILTRVFRPSSHVKNQPLLCRANVNQQSYNGVLGLQPGELVEVKSVEEIMQTLDSNRRNKGLRWMTGMRKYCGKRYRVLKRLQRIMLEDTGELRNMKNTVLLDGVFCDGKEFGSCDRCCFHFWREAWLRRVSES
ncbi:MAG: hypothetical protein P8016_11990 [Sedimentisphaerales bacterium]